MNRSEGQIGNIIGRLEKVTQLIDEVVDGVEKLMRKRGFGLGGL